MILFTLHLGLDCSDSVLIVIQPGLSFKAPDAFSIQCRQLNICIKKFDIFDKTYN